MHCTAQHIRILLDSAGEAQEAQSTLAAQAAYQK